MSEEIKKTVLTEKVKSDLAAKVESMSTNEKYWVLYKKKIIMGSAAVLVMLIGWGAIAGISSYQANEKRKEAAREKAALLALARKKEHEKTLKDAIKTYATDLCYEYSGVNTPVPENAVIKSGIELEDEWDKFTSKNKLTKQIADCVVEENRKLLEVYPGEVANAIQSECTSTGSLDTTLTVDSISFTYNPQWAKIKPKADAYAEVLACAGPIQAARFQNVYLPAVNAEVARVCEVNATGSPTLYDVESDITFSSGWSAVTTQAQMGQQVLDCVAGKKEAAKQAELNSCSQNYDVDQIVKDPDGITGQCFVLHVNISQFDSATGTCAFRGDFDKVPHKYSFDYSANSIYEAQDTYSCPELAGIDNSDFVKVWGKSLGSYSYSTTIGGSATVPKFEILKIEIERKA